MTSSPLLASKLDVNSRPEGSFFFICVFVFVACVIKKRVSQKKKKKKRPLTGGACATRATCELRACLVYALLKTQQTAPKRKRNASETDKRQANKEQTIVIRTADGSTYPIATRLLGKPGLLHTSHSAQHLHLPRMEPGWTSPQVDSGGGGGGGTGRFDRTFFFYVQVLNPNVQSNVLFSLPSLYRRHERQKRAKYEQRIRDVERSTFCPLIWSTSGGAGPAATCFLKRLADKLSEKIEEPYCTTMGWLRCRGVHSIVRRLRTNPP